MISYTILTSGSKKTLAPWRIQSVNPPDVSFRGFFHETAVHGIESSNSGRYELQSTYVGKSKAEMDQVDSDMKVLEVSQVFGSYTKFFAEEIGEAQQRFSTGEH